MPCADLDAIRELNRFPFVEIGVCLQCWQTYRLVQLRLPERKDSGHIGITQ